MHTAAYLRRFFAKRLREYLAEPLCCLTAFLSFCLYLFLFFLFFFAFFFFFPFRTRMSLHRQAPQRGPEKKETKNQNAIISASRGSDRWDVKQKRRKKGSLFAKLWKTDTPLWCKISFNRLCFLLYTDVIFQQWRKVCDMKANVVSIVLSIVAQLIVTLLHGFKL